MEKISVNDDGFRQTNDGFCRRTMGFGRSQPNPTILVEFVGWVDVRKPTVCGSKAIKPTAHRRRNDGFRKAQPILQPSVENFVVVGWVQNPPVFARGKTVAIGKIISTQPTTCDELIVTTI